MIIITQNREENKSPIDKRIAAKSILYVSTNEKLIEIKTRKR